LGGDELELSTFVNSSTSGNTCPLNPCLHTMFFVGMSAYLATRIDNKPKKNEAKLQEKKGSQK